MSPEEADDRLPVAVVVTDPVPLAGLSAVTLRVPEPPVIETFAPMLTLFEAVRLIEPADDVTVPPPEVVRFVPLSLLASAEIVTVPPPMTAAVTFAVSSLRI